jgi:hypothetical protein
MTVNQACTHGSFFVEALIILNYIKPTLKQYAKSKIGTNLEGVQILKVQEII